MTTLPQPTDCCNPCAGARSACAVTCDNSGDSIAVPTTADLRAFLPASGEFTLYQMKSKLGDVTINDGGGADYYFDTASFAVDNGASVVKPGSIDIADAGRWLQHV